VPEEVLQLTVVSLDEGHVIFDVCAATGLLGHFHNRFDPSLRKVKGALHSYLLSAGFSLDLLTHKCNRT
jgi:hypothetical protein